MQVGEPCICRLHRVLEQMTGLSVLSLAGNGLTSLPSSLWNLAGLQQLDLSDNKLTEIPKDIVRLSKLEVRLQQLHGD